MKKFFALVLAVVMVMSMAAVAFAANVGPAWDYDADNDKVRLNGIQYGDRLRYDFRAYSVAREDCDILFHDEYYRRLILLNKGYASLALGTTALSQKNQAFFRGQ